MTQFLVPVLLLALVPYPQSSEETATSVDLELQAEIEYLAAHPIDVNTATVEDLLVVPWLSLRTAEQIIRLRDSLGSLRAAEDLSLVVTDSALVMALVPLLRFRVQREPWQARFVASARNDSAAVQFAPWQLHERLVARRGAWTGLLQLEKDRGETELTDFVGFGLQFANRSVRMVAGDFRLRLGQGLLFGGTGAVDGRGMELGLQQTVAETRYLRGGAAAVRLGCWQVAGLISAARRDAVLRADGTVARLFGSGVHADSAAAAARRTLSELTQAAAVEHSRGALRVTLAAQWLSYDRSIAPRESVESFYGRQLAGAALGLGLGTGPWRLGAEVATASSGGSAGALTLAGDWPIVNVALRAGLRQPGFFAPHGRWRGMTGRRERVDVGVRIGYHHAGLHVILNGNTYHEYSDDSLPARVAIEIGQRLRPAALRFGYGRSYRGEQGRYRTARLGLELLLGPSELTMTLIDEHKETGADNGQALGLRAQTRLGRLRIGMGLGRFWVAGSGVTLGLSEPAAARTSRSFSTGVSCWRTSAGVVWQPSERVRVGVSAGYCWREPYLPDMAAQAELGWAGD